MVSLGLRAPSARHHKQDTCNDIVDAAKDGTLPANVDPITSWSLPASSSNPLTEGEDAGDVAVLEYEPTSPGTPIAAAEHDADLD